MGFYYPDPSTSYYLQNINGKRFLYASDSGSMSGGAGVLAGVEDLFQWKFIPADLGPNPTRYFIQNVGNTQYVTLSTKNNNAWKTVSTSLSRLDCWELISHVQPRSLVTVTVQSRGWRIFEDRLHCIYAKPEDLGLGVDGFSFHWHFVPVRVETPLRVNPSLENKNRFPQGNYRIRSFSGNYVLTMPQVEKGSPYITKLANNETQKWFVKPQSNGLCTISNTATGLYLAGPSKTDLVEGASLLGQSTAFHWNIKAFSPGVNVFFISLQDVELSIGFPNYEAEDLSLVTLQPSESIPSQIWFFETFKQLAPARYHAERLLKPGTYVLESCHDNHGLALSPLGDLYSLDDYRRATRFIVAYADDNTPKFTLSCSDNNGELYLFAYGDRVIASDQLKTEWVVLSSQPNIGTYNICDAASMNPRIALSSRKKLVRGKLYFTLDPLHEQEVMQWWNFCSVNQQQLDSNRSALQDGRG